MSTGLRESADGLQRRGAPSTRKRKQKSRFHVKNAAFDAGRSFALAQKTPRRYHLRFKTRIRSAFYVLRFGIQRTIP